MWLGRLIIVAFQWWIRKIKRVITALWNQLHGVHCFFFRTYMARWNLWKVLNKMNVFSFSRLQKWVIWSVHDLLVTLLTVNLQIAIEKQSLLANWCTFMFTHLWLYLKGPQTSILCVRSYGNTCTHAHLIWIATE